MKIVTGILLLLSVVLAVDYILFTEYEITFAGYWTDRIIIWLWIISFAATLYFFRKKIWSKIIAIAAAIIILVGIVTVIPGVLIISSFTGANRDSHFQLDHEYRLQVERSIMARPRMALIRRNFIFEKKVQSVWQFEGVTPDAASIDPKQVTDARLIDKNDNVVTVQYFYEKGAFTYQHTIQE